MTVTTRLRPPSAINTLREAFSPIEWARNALQGEPVRPVARGDGRPIILAPGYLSNDLSMRGLRKYLQRLGYKAAGWDLGFNDGRVRKLVDELEMHVRQAANRFEEPVTLIGWSLGGVVAREVARRQPDAVREVITLGSPINGGPKYTSIGTAYAYLYSIDLDGLEQEIQELASEGLTQRVTSIFSKTDGIVGWRSSVDTFNEQARNIAVSGGHFGLGNNRLVWRIIAETLAETSR
ncbi:MAG: alpha/beta hydrolase [Pseudomonadota bacterium]